MTVSGNTLTLTAVNGNTTCPGGDLVFNCTITTTTGNIHVVNMQWRRAGASSPAAVYLYTNHPPQSFDGFTTNGFSIPPNTLTSTATLTEAQFSLNNYVLECFSTSPVIQPPRLLSETVLIEGMLPVYMHSCLFSIFTYTYRCKYFPFEPEHHHTSNTDMATSCW